MNMTHLVSKVFLIATFFTFSLQLVAETNPVSSEIPEFNEKEVEARLKKISQNIVDPRFVPAVKGYIKGYVIRNREKTERILGRTVLYFPIFEKHLAANNLPEELKYLSVVESALVARATSRVGAVGLWQFMPATGKELGLIINKDVDERCDPIKSTQAAMIHLHKQYKRFGDWSLALAAYNSGSGRVSRAIKRSRSKNFWRLQRYLPRETRNYVPAFIAATYMMDYYEKHNLVPAYPNLDMQLTKTIKVYEEHSFYRIAQITGLPLDLIEELNPAYIRGFLPENPAGNYLTLPVRVMDAFQDYLDSLLPDSDHARHYFTDPVLATLPLHEKVNANYFESIYVVRQGHTLHSIAQDVGCTVHQIKAWNNLQNAKIRPGQHLIVFSPKEIKRFGPLEKIEDLPTLPTKTPQLFPLPNYKKVEPDTFLQGKYLYYTVKRREKVADIANRIPGVTFADLVKLNGYYKNKTLRPGTTVKILKF